MTVNSWEAILAKVRMSSFVYGAGLAGFTLLEMIVTVAVLAITLAIAFPNFSMLIRSNQLTSNANELVGSLQFARSEAIRKNATIVVCGSSDGATCNNGSWGQWITVEKSGGAVLRIVTAKSTLTMLSSPAISGNNNEVEFRADGLARDKNGLILNAALSACIPKAMPKNNVRIVSIFTGSRVTVSSSNSNGVCGAPGNPSV